jgi:hypothetical protein
VSLPAGLDQEALAVADRPHRARGRPGVDEHAVRCLRGVDRRRDGVAAVRVRLREEEAPVHERHVRGHDDRGGADVAAVGLDARIPFVDEACARVLEDVAAVTGDRLGKAEQVLPGVELRLVLEAHGAGDLERERCLGHERRGQAEPPHHLGLVLELRAFLRALGEHVVVLALEVAVDSAPRAQLLNPLDRGLVRLGVGSRTLLTERIGELSVGGAVARRDLGRRVARGSADDSLRVQEPNPLSAALEQNRRGHACDACADDGHVHVDSARELGIRSLGGRRDPIGLATMRHLTTIAVL